MSISNYLENQVLDAVFNNLVGALPVAATWVQLHIGSPGEAGTANPAAHTTRIQATWGAAASGSLSTDAAVDFQNLTANETITHISVWDASTAGNHLWYGALVSSRAVEENDTLSFPIGDITVTLD